MIMLTKSIFIIEFPQVLSLKLECTWPMAICSESIWLAVPLATSRIEVVLQHIAQTKSQVKVNSFFVSSNNFINYTCIIISLFSRSHDVNSMPNIVNFQMINPRPPNYHAPSISDTDLSRPKFKVRNWHFNIKV